MPPGILVFTLKQVVYAWTGKLQLQSPKVARLHLSEVVKHIHMKVLLQSTHTLKQPIYWYNKSGCRYSSAGHTAHLNIQIFFTAWPEAATIHNTNNDFIIFAIEQITNKRWDGKLKSRKKNSDNEKIQITQEQTLFNPAFFIPTKLWEVYNYTTVHK